ncbi:flagellar protein FlaG [Paenibacillus sp. GCM10023252]|uniref:flagellar protein FlaG n=1 Tax=Paenibacillus sp. GCM10023252 TaxID=3252649 RepID=UPI00361EC444
MSIQPVLPQSQSATARDTAIPIVRVAGEYDVIKEKSKFEILSVSESALLQAIDKANLAVAGTPHVFNYKLHDSGHLIVQVLNKDTQEIIREIPSEKFIEIVEKLQELTVGAIIDEKR